MVHTQIILFKQDDPTSIHKIFNSHKFKNYSTAIERNRFDLNIPLPNLKSNGFKKLVGLASVVFGTAFQALLCIQLLPLIPSPVSSEGVPQRLTLIL